MQNVQIVVRVDQGTADKIDAFTKQLARTNPGANRSDAVRVLLLRGLAVREPGKARGRP